MKIHKGFVLPGQLIASMHTFAIAKLIRRMMKAEKPDDVAVKGVLLDKSVGGFHCSLCVCFSQLNNPKNWKSS